MPEATQEQEQQQSTPEDSKQDGPKPDQPKEESGKKEEKKEPEKPKKSIGQWAREHPLGVILIIVLIVALAIGGYLLKQYLDSYEATDDAQIDGNIYSVTSRVAGQLKAVYVEDNQVVKAGTLLAELDPKDYGVSVSQARATLAESETQVRAEQPNVPITRTTTETTVSTAATDVASAKADVAAAQAQIAVSQRDYEAAVAQVRQAEADNVKAQSDLARYRALVQKDEVSREQFDQKEAAAKAAAATVEARAASAESEARDIDQSRAKLLQSEARLQQAITKGIEAEKNRPQQVAMRRAMVESRKASAERDKTLLDQALLNLSYTRILAPVDGVVGRKNAQPGQQASAGQQLMSIVPLTNIWVTANFKETQLRMMRPGQRVTIHVDAYDRDYEGSVENFAGASGARFSLLPPENATGNYVKVVQRVPVRIRFKEGQDNEHLLRPGMSVNPKVWLNTNSY